MGLKSTGSTNSATEGSLYNERNEAENKLELTKQMYEDKISSTRQLTDAFFDAYQRDIDNSFNLYKYSRDSNDTLSQKITDASFQLYKYSRDGQDTLASKIAEVDKKVDMMSAIRPYQDALINAKIDNVALVSDFNLARRTCKMIEGTLVLPSSQSITGYPTGNSYYYYTPTSGTT